MKYRNKLVKYASFFLPALSLLICYPAHPCPAAQALDGRASTAGSAPANGQISIIPRPLKMERGEGEFVLSAETVILAAEGTESAAEFLAGRLAPATGFGFQVKPLTGSPERQNSIVLRIEPALNSLGPEGYSLQVLENRIMISASSPAGIFYGCQSLRQLLPPAIESREKMDNLRWSIPSLKIEDSPRFAWRGFMLDCSRTFQSVEYLKRNIDLLSLYKLNVFHLHLTDDQGWRVAIERYPELTAIGARFPERWHKPGGFYTRAELAGLVDYAARRNVRIVPEIEMPGHSLAALACHPELSCSGGPFEIYPFFQGPGIQENIFCAGKEATFEFLENILKEVADIFPGEYIHIGGDEAPKAAWKKCPDCQARIRAAGLKDEEELQSYFIRRIEKVLMKYDRRLIGWDEILQGGLAPEATVMSWRGMEGGVAAAKAGHAVIMSPTSHCYLDYTHEETPVEKSYAFEPVPASLSPDKARHILGLQGNMWTHIATDEPAVDRQVFPREIALAEAAWTAPELRDWPDFSRRLAENLKRLDALGVGYYGKTP